MFEIEQKFRLENRHETIAKLSSLGFEISHEEPHIDTYLRHPARDFATSGEALRVRRVGEKMMVTYKGPKLAGPVKIRPEIELPIDGAFEDWLQFWQHLSFTIAEQVRKVRLVMKSQQYPSVTIAVDSVERLGDFVEIEILLPENEDRAAAVKTIEVLALQIGLQQVEPRSYLRQILELSNKT